MKKKKNSEVIAIIVLIIILAILIYLYVKPTTTVQNSVGNASATDSDITEVQVSTRTIENNLSSSGQVSSALDEKIYLYASYYFKELLVDTNVYIAEGTNLVEYKNGKFLTAPYDCVLISSNVPEEDVICTTNHYLQIQSIDTLKMSLSVSETEISKVSIGDEVQITFTSNNDVITGYITQISEVGSYSSSGSYFDATVTFENNGNLKIGMSATCEIILEKVENTIAVPINAIQSSDEYKYVIVVNSDGSTSNVNVETGISDDSYIEISSGLSGGETIQMQNTSGTNSNNSMMQFMEQRSSFNGGEVMVFQGGDSSGGQMQRGM